MPSGSRVEYVPEAEKPGVGTVRSAEVRIPAARLETLGCGMGLFMGLL